MGFIIENGTSSYTNISNTFIEDYMPSANGEYVKVYIYLMKCANSSDFSASICTIADVLDIMEKDVIRAFKYWEKAGLLELSFDDNKKLSSLTIKDCEAKDSEKKGVAASAKAVHLKQASAEAENSKSVALASAPPKVFPETTKQVESTVPEKKSYTKYEKQQILSDNYEVQQLFHIAEVYLAHPLSQTESNTLLYIYDVLKFSPEMIDYLIEYCADNDHKSIYYIESVAIAWASKDINTLEKAKEYTKMYRKYGSSIMKSFGIVGRMPAPEELNYIVKWTNVYGFKLDLILEACNKTIMTTHNASFPYADKILSNWKEKGVVSIEDVQRVDEEFQNSVSKSVSSSTPKAESKKVAKKSIQNDFNNFPQHTYDFEALEKALLNK